MGKKRNQYTKEYKVEAVRLMVEKGRPISELSRELGTA
jgi:transposase-like protein